MQKVVLKVKGMHCASCSVLIDKLVGKQPGVITIQTSYGAEKTAIEFDETKISLKEIDKFINQLGYDLIRPDEESASIEEEEGREIRKIEEARRRFVAALFLALPIILYYMAIHMFNMPHVHELFDFMNLPYPVLADSSMLSYIGFGIQWCFWVIAQPLNALASLFVDTTNPPIKIDLNWIYWILTTPIQFVIGWQFYRNSFTSIRVGSANMDVLVALGTSAAYFYSMLGFLFFNIDHPFWESTAALLVFILLGRYVEMVAKGRASAAIKELMKLEAKEAHVIRDGQELTIPVDQLVVGDIIIVKPGEKVPVDGTIVEGKTHLDEKVVTGESYPVSKTVNDQVIGATINQEGLIKVKAEKIGKETLLYQIIRMVEEAQARKAPIQDLVDKISEYFVPAVVTLSVLTFCIWYFIFVPDQLRPALTKMIAVLVISCPCAMGLATPTALVVGIGRAAKFGIILKGGEALEKAYRVNAVAFDKTGTLTIGKPVVTDFEMVNKEFDMREAVYLAGALEKGSEHPLARAIVEKAKAEHGNLEDPQEFEAVSGMGLHAKVKGKEVAIGNQKYMEKLGVDTSGLHDLVARLQEEAKTVVYMLVEGRLTAVIAMADDLKPYAKEAIAELKRMGKSIIMITGDNPRTAAAIAKKVGIDRFLAEVLPQDKADNIKKLQAEGLKVAMVGDGINDSPALAQSDLGIAVGSGTDVAIETGEIILVKDDLRDVATSIQLSSKTIKKVWQNLFWAFFYNVVAIPVAAGAHLMLTQTAGQAAPWVVKFTEKLGWLGQPIFNLSQATLRPEIAGFAMAFSSISVVMNSLTLKRFIPPIEKQIMRSKRLEEQEGIARKVAA